MRRLIMHYVMYKTAENNLKAILSLFHEHTHKPQKCESSHRNGSFRERVREPLWAAEKGMSKKVLITFNFFLHNLGHGDLSAASLLLLFGSKYGKYLMI